MGVMARLPRLLLPGLPAHVYIRGNDGQAIFRTEGDRIYFHRCMVDRAREHGVAIHAYVWMTNHVHLLATGAEAGSISRLVQGMGRRYVSYFNYLHGRTGTLWEGRFGSCLVESDRYFLVCHRYVELNPVRAGIAGGPGEYLWSSYRCNAQGVKDDLVTPHSLYMELGADELRRRANYRRLFAEDINPKALAAIRHSIRKGWALGGEKFCRWLEGEAGRPVQPRPPGRPRKIGGNAGRRGRKNPELT
jgi:putative transposase